MTNPRVQDTVARAPGGARGCAEAVLTIALGLISGRLRVQALGRPVDIDGNTAGTPTQVPEQSCQPSRCECDAVTLAVSVVGVGRRHRGPVHGLLDDHLSSGWPPVKAGPRWRGCRALFQWVNRCKHHSQHHSGVIMKPPGNAAWSSSSLTVDRSTRGWPHRSPFDMNMQHAQRAARWKGSI